jgi:3-carboxy-cis,cis-muconate cycloisomerase
VEDASKKARREKKHLQEILSAEPAILSLISATVLAKLFEPLNNIGVADQFVDRVLAAPKSPERR